MTDAHSNACYIPALEKMDGAIALAIVLHASKQHLEHEHTLCMTHCADALCECFEDALSHALMHCVNALKKQVLSVQRETC